MKYVIKHILVCDGFQPPTFPCRRAAIGPSQAPMSEIKN